MMIPDDRQECFLGYKKALWSQIDKENNPDVGNLLNLLTSEISDLSVPLYLRTDSHWNNLGSLVAVKEAVNHFSPKLWRDSEVYAGGETKYLGDLTGLRGEDTLDQTFVFGIRRPDIILKSQVNIDNLPGQFNIRYRNEGPSERLIRGKTVLFLDSFGMAAIAQIVPFFEDLTTIRLVDFDQERYLSEIRAADRVWVMSVERSASYRFSFEIGSQEFLDKLIRDL
jgi:hypothetical protein